MASTSGLRVLELFSGIGAVSCVLEGVAEIVAAVDLSRPAAGVYTAWHGREPMPVAVDHLDQRTWDRFEEDLWWLSPPCQPFTQRGRRLDLEDRRCRGLRAVLRRLEDRPPRYLALENVVGFKGSQAHRTLRRVLDGAGFHSVAEIEDCPARLGWPNRRPRFYVLASRDTELLPAETPPRGDAVGEASMPLVSDLLDRVPDPALKLDPGIAERYRGVLDGVDASDPKARTACFTSAYGRSIVKSGSYLRTDSGLRFFSPDEILRFLGFPEHYRFPPDLPRKMGWRLAGNSLSLPVVASLLRRIPELAPLSSLSPPCSISEPR